MMTREEGQLSVLMSRESLAREELSLRSSVALLDSLWTELNESKMISNIEH